MKIGLIVPHIFMQEAILPHVIFSPAILAIQLADELTDLGQDVTLFSPGPVKTKAKNINADLSLFEVELKLRGDDYMDLLKKHPFTFVTLARQIQAELAANAIDLANQGAFDVLHVYTNEEDIALPLAKLCTKPIAFTHHDPFNFLIKYKSVFPKYPSLNWLSISMSQRQGMPKNTNWVGNINHGLPPNEYTLNYQPTSNYVAYLGRIISSKGVHLAIKAVQEYNKFNKTDLKLKIAGKHYSDHAKDSYWQTHIEPQLADPNIEYVGYLKTTKQKQEFLGNAKALLIPSVFEEPFGMVMIEALACATPIIGLNSGAIPEVIKDGQTGLLINKVMRSNGSLDEPAAVGALANALGQIGQINRQACREDFELRFTARRMAAEHLDVYKKLIKE